MLKRNLLVFDAGRQLVAFSARVRPPQLNQTPTDPPSQWATRCLGDRLSPIRFMQASGHPQSAPTQLGAHRCTCSHTGEGRRVETGLSAPREVFGDVGTSDTRAALPECAMKCMMWGKATPASVSQGFQGNLTDADL